MKQEKNIVYSGFVFYGSVQIPIIKFSTAATSIYRWAIQKVFYSYKIILTYQEHMGNGIKYSNKLHLETTMFVCINQLTTILNVSCEI